MAVFAPAGVKEPIVFLLGPLGSRCVHPLPLVRIVLVDEREPIDSRVITSRAQEFGTGIFFGVVAAPASANWTALARTRYVAAVELQELLLDITSIQDPLVTFAAFVLGWAYVEPV